MKQILGVLCLVPVLATTSTSSAETFGATVARDSGYPYMEPLLDKLFVFKVGAKCAAKLPKKDDGAARASGYAAREVIKHALRVTGKIWPRSRG
jgi:hypothetical protein